MSFFWNMLQYTLKFESVLFNFTIIYITFLFSLGPLPLSPHLLFLPTVSSSPSPKCISSLSLSLLHVTAPLSDETQAGASSHATPRHTNPTYTLRLPSTNTATRTRPTTSTTTHGLITTPRRRACRAIHHVIRTSHHRISLNWPAVVGFAFGFV